MSSPLSNLQKKSLSMLALRAFNLERARALGRGELWPHAQDTWRHDQVAACTGKMGLRCCSQDDYSTVAAHFEQLLGNTGTALRHHMDAATNTRRQIEHKIIQQAEAMGRSLNYADAICRRMTRGASLLEATEKQLWNVFFALRYEQQRRAKSEASAKSEVRSAKSEVRSAPLET